MFPAALLALATAGEPQAAGRTAALSAELRPAVVASDRSVQRIRVALEQPAPITLTVDLPQPTFRVEVREHLYWTDIPQKWDFNGGGVPFKGPSVFPPGIGTTPIMTVDLMPLVRAIKKLAR